MAVKQRITFFSLSLSYMSFLVQFHHNQRERERRRREQSKSFLSTKWKHKRDFFRSNLTYIASECVPFCFPETLSCHFLRQLIWTTFYDRREEELINIYMNFHSARILLSTSSLWQKYALQDMSFSVYDENWKDVSLLDSKTLTMAKREGKGLVFSVTLQGDASLIKTLQKLSAKREKPVGRRNMLFS